jgi:putative sterol carrier protein
MVDETLKAQVIDRIKEETFGFGDIMDYMLVVTQLCNADAKVQKKTAGDQLTFQFLIEDGDDFWLKVDDGTFSSEVGKIDSPQMVIGMDQRTCGGVFGNRINATSAYLNRDMSFEGSLKLGLKFRNIFKMINNLLGLK